MRLGPLRQGEHVRVEHIDLGTIGLDDLWWCDTLEFGIDLGWGLVVVIPLWFIFDGHGRLNEKNLFSHMKQVR